MPDLHGYFPAAAEHHRLLIGTEITVGDRVCDQLAVM